MKQVEALLIGRVYAGAVIIDTDIDDNINSIITDSKKMSKKNVV